MEYITEIIKTEVKAHYDIIVVGGGPSGSAAAIAAGRKGARVLLVEKMNCLGGMWTSGLVNPLFDYDNKNGIMKEIVTTLKARNAWGGFCGICFDYEQMKSLLEEMCMDAGVTLLYDTMYVKPIMEDKTVKGIICENISGRSAYTADMIIDCSSDGRVAADAGAEFEIGNGGYESCQAMTLMFLVSGFPKRYFDPELKMPDFVIYNQLKRVYDMENETVPFDMPYLIPIPNTDFAVVQFTHMYGCDPLSAEDITKATIEGRRQMMKMAKLLRKYDEEFRNLNVIFSAPMLGVRESRRIKGEYTITKDDLMSGAQFEDGVTNVTFNVDIHAQDSHQKCFEVSGYQIPLRSMLPKGIENMIVAGKSISGTHEAMASYRVTGNCCEMGEAAGIAAAYCVKTGTKLRDVDIKKLLKTE